MLDATAILVEHWVEHLATGYRRTYGQLPPDLSHPLTVVARLAIERLSSSDALYHDTRHTLLVTAVGQAILRGGLMVEPVPPRTGCTSRWPRSCTTSATCAGVCPAIGTAATSSTSAAARLRSRAAPPTPSSRPTTSTAASSSCATAARRSPGLDVERLCRADRADAVPGAGGRRPRRDRHRGRPRPGGGPDRPARRPGLPAPAGGALRRVPGDRDGGAGSATPTRPTWPSATRGSSGARWSPISARRSPPRADRRGPAVDGAPLRPRLRRGAQAPAAGAGPAIARLRC